MIVFERVTKIYEPNVAALRDVSFMIEKGEFVFVVGASGSGKSTVIRLLLRELEPLRPGPRRRPRHRPAEALEGPAAAAQPGLRLPGLQAPPHRSAYENVAYALKVMGGAADHPAQGARGALARRALGQDELPAGRALRRRATAGLDRARRRQPSAAAGLRRADREPRSRRVSRDHAVALPDQPPFRRS